MNSSQLNFTETLIRRVFHYVILKFLIESPRTPPGPPPKKKWAKINFVKKTYDNTLPNFAETLRGDIWGFLEGPRVIQ